MKQPHDSWGAFYDFVYEKSFGNYYFNLTAETVETIRGILSTGVIVDFGAGTGRLTHPLAENGYKIIAVEKSNEMVNALTTKQNENVQIQTHNCSIAAYNGAKADLAMALFTVLSYSTTEEELTRNIKNICWHIKEKGFFFFDLPDADFFHGGRVINIQTTDFNRFVEINQLKDDVHIYNEKCNGIFNGKEFQYEDEFRIRYWSLNTLDRLLKENGLKDTCTSFPKFNWTGSTYKLYTKL